MIRQCSVDDMVADPNFSGILDEYADELAIEGLPHPSAKIEMYKQLESIGKLHPIAAFLDGKIIGFINVLMVMNPHYGVDIAVSESFFVAKEHRKSGAGMKLRSAAEVLARQIGSPGIFISAPSKGPLAQVLPCVGYKETSRTFFREFAHA